MYALPEDTNALWTCRLAWLLARQEKACRIDLRLGCCLQGKGLGFGAVADFVHSLKLVVANGTVITYNAAHPRFNEARMSFGLMGVIVEITFSLSSKWVSPDAPIVQDDNTFPTLREVFGRPDAGAYIKARPALNAPGCSPAQILSQGWACEPILPPGLVAGHSSCVSHWMLHCGPMCSASNRCQAVLTFSLQAETLWVKRQQPCKACNMTLGLGLCRPL